MFQKIFLSHPATVEETYFQHMTFALKFCGALSLATLAALVHAIIPCLFEKTASKIVAGLYERTRDRGN